MRKNSKSTDHLPFSSLIVDERAQRAVIPARVRKLVAEWDLGDVGVITVSIRDGHAYIIDGQHRVRAAMEKGLGETKALCHVYRGLSLEEEAEKFLALNDSRSVTPFDSYRIGLVAKDPECLGVQAILAKHGLEISGTKSDGYVNCVGAVMALYEKDPALLDDVCAVLGGAWGTRSAAYERIIVAGAGIVLGRYNGELDRPQLAKKLAKYPGGAAGLQGDAKGYAGIKPISVSRAAAEVMVDTYNRGRRSKVLPAL